MHEYLMPMLECPACHGNLDWTIEKSKADHIEQAEARCTSCGAIYPVSERIGVFLTPDLQRHDLWEEGENELYAYLREHTEIEHTLLNSPLEKLSPADQFIRAMVLEDRGDHKHAHEAARIAHTGLYTQEYQECFNSQIEYVTKLVSSRTEPIIDLASGRCYLVEQLAKGTSKRIVATDFSPRVLQRDQRLFEFLGVVDRINLLAFDARRTPFRNRSVRTMTSNVGLANIENPGGLLQELRRVINAELISIMLFYPRDDSVNGAQIDKLGLSSFIYEDSTLRLFDEAGFDVDLANIQVGRALPTPKSELFEGAVIDTLPIAETELTWCTLIAHPKT